jgi:DNA polymerase-3 subunit delta
MADAPDKPVYLVVGTDRPKIETAITRLRTHFAPEATDVVSALDVSGEGVVSLCNSGSLFGDGRLVVVDELDGRLDSEGRRKGGWKAADIEFVTSYLAAPAPGTVLALVAADAKKASPLWKACAKSGQVLEYSLQKGKLLAWIADQFRQRGARAEPEACAALVHVVGEDLTALATEIDKLATWAGGEPIGEREVLALSVAFGDEPLYKLTDLVGARDGAAAIAFSETTFEQDASPRASVSARMSGAVSGHVTRLATLKRLADRGVSSKQAATDLKLHPFRAQKLYQQAEGFSAEELAEALVRVAELDGSLKGQSRLAPDLEVQRALVDLTRKPGGAPPARS